MNITGNQIFNWRSGHYLIYNYQKDPFLLTLVFYPHKFNENGNAIIVKLIKS
jgi:hypothetical protein